MNYLPAAALVLSSLYAAAQGTFTYTFLQDTSPLKLTATFQASQEAVQTGFLTLNLSSQGRILTGQPRYILYQGVQCPITGISFPVDPMNGAPTLVSGASLTDVAASTPKTKSSTSLSKARTGTRKNGPCACAS
jgi:hypothetical protein